MNRYIAKLPLWVRLAIFVVIAIAIMASFWTVGIFIVTNSSRPISQLPLYFWISTLAVFVIGIFGAERFHPLDMSVSSALLRIGLASILLVGGLFSGQLNGAYVFSFAQVLPWGIRGAWALMRTWQLRSDQSMQS